ncbi:MAG: class I SAM-dependent methyltransferase [Thermoplasmata archaeon]|nr:MAG: class I SAM-dependent methyltransferase [Thermoplasmata archaeon]
MLKEGDYGRPCNLCNRSSSNIIFNKNGYDLVKCPSCGLVYVGNPPSAAEIKRLYTYEAGYHIGCKDDSTDLERWFHRAEKYYDLIAYHKTGGRILDIGCGGGLFLKVAKDHGWETYGVEISSDTSSHARQRYGLDVTTGTLEETHFEPRFFDVVTMWDVIEHMEDPSHAMTIVHGILKDDGIVTISTPNIDGLFPRTSYKISSKIKYWPHPEPPHHLFQFSKETISQLLNRTGFEVVDMLDEAIQISYSFGSIKSLIRSPKRLLYASLFIPLALIGPKVKSGDWITVVARKSSVPLGT